MSTAKLLRCSLEQIVCEAFESICLQPSVDQVPFLLQYAQIYSILEFFMSYVKSKKHYAGHFILHSYSGAYVQCSYDLLMITQRVSGTGPHLN